MSGKNIDGKVTKEMVAGALAKIPEKEDVQPLIYCGPSITSIGLQQFAVFKGGIPEHAEALKEGCPSVVQLFKSAKDLAVTRRKIAEKGSRDYQLYQNVLKYMEKEG